MVSAIKKALKKRFPNVSDKELSSRAYAIATKRWQDKYGKNPSRGESMTDDNISKEEKKYTEEGYEIIAENVPMIISTAIEYDE